MDRRRFLKTAAAGGAAMVVPEPFWRFHVARPEVKLNLGIIGVANRGADNLGAVANETIAALCDVDEGALDRAAKKHSGARRFVDFRDLIDSKGLDAVVISTPDHTHAPAAARAMRAGLDVYCEKPLTHTVAEARALRHLAHEFGRVTQMGIQIHALPNYRRVAEILLKNTLGMVRECHVFCNGKTWSGGERPTERPPVPKGLHWDLWLGPAAERPYHPSYHPGSWRRFWAFGGGTLADMGCHYTDLAFWALGLKHPQTIAATGPTPHEDTAPDGMRVDYHFPTSASGQPVNLSWYDGGAAPEVLSRYGLKEWANGVLFIGEKGWLCADYSRHVIGPKEFVDKVVLPEPYLPVSPGHHAEWLKACRTRVSPSCGFEYSGPLTETILLGVLAYRAQTPLTFDAARMVVTDSPVATLRLKKSYRSGFGLD